MPPRSLFLAEPTDALDRQRRLSRFLGDQSALFFDNGAHTILAIETAEDLTRRRDRCGPST